MSTIYLKAVKASDPEGVIRPISRRGTCYLSTSTLNHDLALSECGSTRIDYVHRMIPVG